MAVRSTTASGSLVYESEKATQEYLQFHYGIPQALFPFPMELTLGDALEFPARCAKICIRNAKGGPLGRAMDVGCAVGRSSFELARECKEVVGLDFSHRFIEAANKVKEAGEVNYVSIKQGDITSKETVLLDSSIDRSRVNFEQGDACNLREDIGLFDIVLAANLLCRLPKPQTFLDRLPKLVRPGGIVALVSPYSWLEEYTPRDAWIGGTFQNEKEVDSFESLKKKMADLHFELVHREDMPFLIREHARKFQWGCSDATVWCYSPT